jgi:hypothetical protein
VTIQAENIDRIQVSNNKTWQKFIVKTRERKKCFSQENLSNKAIKALNRRLNSNSKTLRYSLKSYSLSKKQERKLKLNKSKSTAVYFHHIIKPIALKPDQYETYKLTRNLMNIKISAASENPRRPCLNLNKMKTLEGYELVDEGIDNNYDSFSPESLSSSSSWSSLTFRFGSFLSIDSGEFDQSLSNSNGPCDIDLHQIEND